MNPKFQNHNNTPGDIQQAFTMKPHGIGPVTYGIYFQDFILERLEKAGIIPSKNEIANEIWSRMEQDYPGTIDINGNGKITIGGNEISY